MRILTLTLLFIALCTTQSFSQLVWNSTRPLTFADFKGKTPHDSTSVAATYCSIETKVCKHNFWNGKITISVEATFFPDTSWYLADRVHDLTLPHEQGHFDIAEWFARKLRKAIEEEIRSVDDYNRNFQATYDRVWQEYFRTQEKYEKETGHGTLFDGQLRWNMLIHAGLDSLKKYEKSGC